jgi:hypothetical protein
VFKDLHRATARKINGKDGCIFISCTAEEYENWSVEKVDEEMSGGHLIVRNMEYPRNNFDKECLSETIGMPGKIVMIGNDA